MRKILMAATALCCMTMTMIAEPVSPSAARQAAEKFLQGKGVALKSEAMRAPRRAMSRATDNKEQRGEPVLCVQRLGLEGLCHRERR